MAATEGLNGAVSDEAAHEKGVKRRFEFLYPLGLVGGLAALIGAALVDGTNPASFVNMAAFLIVIVGTTSAALVQHPMPTVMRAIRMLRLAIFPPAEEPEDLIDRISQWAKLAKTSGLISLDAHLADIKDPFMRKGMQMVVDGMEPAVVRKTLQVRLRAELEQSLLAANFYEAAGGYSPTFGIMGAVTGLIEVMHHISQPSEIGTGIASAFVSTVYGLVFANVFCIPTANRLRQVVGEQTVLRNIFLEGAIGIARGVNAIELREILESYYTRKRKTPQAETVEAGVGG